MKSKRQEMRRRMWPMLAVSVVLVVAAGKREAVAVEAAVPVKSPAECCYAPPGEYVKDHTLICHDGWWHLFSQSGTEGYSWGNSGNEETVSWSISRDLVNWEFRGHVLHASQRKDHFDQHEIWATFCLPVNGGFYMFYGGGRLPVRPVEYRKLGTSMEVLSRLKHGGVMPGVAVGSLELVVPNRNHLLSPGSFPLRILPWTAARSPRAGRRANIRAGDPAICPKHRGDSREPPRRRP